MDRNKGHIEYSDGWLIKAMREVVFGMEDGMVSTLGALTGIAVGSGDQFVVVLSGLVIVAVESISMGVGSYISNVSEWDINRHKIYEEKQEIKNNLDQERLELKKMFVADGWPTKLASQMAVAAGQDKKLMLKELTYRELNLPLAETITPGQRGLAMFFSYILGGLVPLFAYFFLPLSQAIYVSISVALVGLFTLGALTAQYSKANWVKTGLRVFLLGSAALLMGYLIGELANNFLK